MTTHHSNDVEKRGRATRPPRAAGRLATSLLLALVGILALLPAPVALASAAAGYNTFIIPVDEDTLATVLEILDDQGVSSNTHSVITVTAWADDTAVCVDHWENSYGYDPDSPGTSVCDEAFTLDLGESRLLESINITVPRVPGTAPYPYDGGDIIYVAGGTANVSRAGWIQAVTTLQALAWDVYPVRPQLLKYILPFGEELSTAGLLDFNRVFAVVQATRNGTTLQVDFNRDGTFDSLDWDRNGTVDGTSTTLNKGEVFLLDRVSIGNQAINYPGTIPDATAANGTTDNRVITGTVIEASDTIQVQYIVGDPGVGYETRGFSAFPRGFWDDEYYAPVDESTKAGYSTEIYVYNPQASAITVDWETSTASGTFSVPAASTVSYLAAAGVAVPQGSGVYLKGSDVFWAVSTIDTEGNINEWGYPLVPAALLVNEATIGWAPAYDFDQVIPPYVEPSTLDQRSGLFITAVQDGTTVFVDENNDGAVDQTFTIDRLDSIYVVSSDTPAGLNDDDLTGARVFATGPIAMAYGQNPDFSFSGDPPALDLGYTILPTADTWFELVVDVAKTVDPAILAANTAGATTTFTVHAFTREYSLDDVAITDTLPTGWEYVAGFTTITLPDLSTVTGATADDGNATGATAPTWSGSDVFGSYADLGENQSITISFRARTTVATFNDGDISINNVEVLGTRTVGSVTQNFRARATAFVAYSDSRMTIDKSSDVDPVAYPGDTVNYTVVLENTGTTALTGLSLYDAMPPGTTYVAASGQVIGRKPGTVNVRDELASVAYNLNHGTVTWVGSWVESDAAQNPGLGNVQSLAGELRLALTNNIYRQVDLSNAVAATLTLDYDTLAADNGEWAYVEVASSAGGPWTVALQFENVATGSLSYAIPSGLWSATTTVRARCTGYDANEYFYVDNVDIAFSSMAATTVGDTFASQAYSRNDGSASWAGVWVESDAAQSATAGDVQVNGGELRLTGTRNIYRQVNLSGMSWATLSLGYRTNGNADNADTAYVEVASSAAGPWTTALTFVNDATGKLTYSVPGGLLAATTTVRIRTDNYSTTEIEYFYVDNVVVAFGPPASAPVAYATGDPPGFLSSNDGFFLAVGESATLTFSVTVDDPFPAGVVELHNTAYARSRELPIPISDDVRDPVVVPSSAGATVGDRVWLDSDGDGVLDPGEAGLAGIQVTLRDQWGTPIQVTVTDSLGRYSFSDVPPGNDYFVQVTGGLPAGLTQTNGTLNRTAPFDLSAGEVYLDADLGYESPSPVIGDLVWSDGDGDGLLDPGEPGLAGVVVQLYLDNGDGILNTAVDTLVDTTTTGATGNYLFSGMASGSGQDYFVYVPPSGNPVLTGYTNTTPNPALLIDVAPGDVLLTADFGFADDPGIPGSVTYTITDRVWLDDGSGGGTADSGTQDGGEVGVPGVTVALLDDDGTIIAVTTTGSNGTFQFSGVPAGVNYSWRITDENHVLGDAYGTTLPAVVGSYQMVGNLSSDLDFSSAPNFGYNVARAIGDTVFVDNGSGGGTASDGIQNGAETGIPNVVVQLYVDLNADNALTVADGAPVATLITDANGRYLFSGLAAGTYFVSIASGQTALAGYALTTTDDEAFSGHQQEATIVGSGSDLTADFGYRAPVEVSVGGTVWENNDPADDQVDAGEPLLAGVTVDLVQGGVVIRTTTTDANGEYLFDGLPEGTYTVRITDTGGVLSGYSSNYELTEGTSGPFNYEEVVTLSDGMTQDPVSFGYFKARNTFAVVAGIRAYTDGGGAVVAFETASEVGSAGFFVERWSRDTRAWSAVGRVASALRGGGVGAVYQVRDHGVGSGETHDYRLVEVEAEGRVRAYGPWTVTVDGRDWFGARQLRSPLAELEQRDAFDGDARGTARAPVASPPLALVPAAAGSVDGVTVLVGESGVYALPVDDLAAAFGLDAAKLEELLDAGRVRLVDAAGRDVATTVRQVASRQRGLVFYGQATASLYTATNAYRLTLAAGQAMRQLSEQAPPPAAPSVMTHTITAEEDLVALYWLEADPAADFWRWAGVFAGAAPTVLSVPSPSPASASRGVDAILRLRVQGALDLVPGDDHLMEVSFNGRPVLATSWDGLDLVELEVALPSELVAAANTVAITATTAPGAAWGAIWVDRVELSYQRLLEARDNRLSLTADRSAAVTLGGFASGDLVVLDVTRPLSPRLVNGIATAVSGGGVLASLVVHGGRSYELTTTAALRRASLVPYHDSGLADDDLAADYLVVAPRALLAAAEELVKLRHGRFMPLLVAAEDVYDTFSGGLPTPQAFHDLLVHAHQSWSVVPTHLVLVGRGTFDHKDRLGLGGSLLPLAMVATESGLFASDSSLGDVDGDGLAEVAVGRIGVTSEADLRVYLAKLEAYETADGGWRHRTLLIADDGDPLAADFAAASEEVAALLPRSMRVDRVYHPAGGNAEVSRQSVRDFWNEGAVLVSYAGHAAVPQLADEALLHLDDVADLSNGARLPVLLATTCVVGNGTFPGYDSLVDALVRHDGGGAIAAFAPTGLSNAQEAAALGRTVVEVLMVSPPKATLGEVVVAATRRFVEAGGSQPMLAIYQISGDPGIQPQR